MDFIVPSSNKINVLWSGGLDSTILVYHLAKCYPQSTIVPIYLQIPQPGKRHQERAINAIGEKMRSIFPNVQATQFVDDYRWGLSRFPHVSANRNLRMCELMAKLGASHIFYGGYLAGSHFPDDNTYQILSKLAGLQVWNWDRIMEGCTKEGVFKFGLGCIPPEVLKLSWSCQLWWNTPCMLCFSCIERDQLFLKFYGHHDV